MSRIGHGRRFPSRGMTVLLRGWIVVGTVVAVAVGSSVVPAGGSGSGGGWPNHRSDLANTGASTTETVISPANASTLGLDWSMTGPYRSSPAVQGGVAYLSCEKAAVCAVDAASGRLLWRTTVGNDYAPRMPVVSGAIVYVGWSRPATVTALATSTGVVLWSSQIAVRTYDVQGPPVVSDGLVHQAVADDKIYTLDAFTGAQRWVTDVSLPSPPAVADGVLYVGGAKAPGANGGSIYALRATTGQVLWKREAQSADRLQSPVVSGGRLYVPLNNGYFGAPAPSFAAFDLAACATGPCQPLWTYTSSRGFSSAPAFSGGVVYQAFSDGYIHALDASTGRLLWEGATVAAGQNFATPGPPTVANGLVYASGDEGKVYAWPTTGCTNAICPPIWVGDVGGRTQPQVSGSEVTVVDGHVFVVNSAGVLSSFSPKPAPAPPPPALELSTVRSWGLGHVGQLGTGSTTDRTAPGLTTGLAGITKLSAGGYHTLALRKDKAARGWGWNQFGQANGGLSNSAAPLDVTNSRDVRDISAGVLHSLFVTGDEGTVWAMGSSQYGVLGLGNDTTGGPSFVPDFSGVRSVSAGGIHSLALKNDGTVWAWGSNVVGQLGTGSTADSNRPLRVPGLDRVVAISAGLFHSLALKEDGTVWAWGWNVTGQLGTGQQSGEIGRVPARVVGLSGVRSVSAGGLHSLAVSNDGRLSSWGWNGVGQLGIGRTGDIAWTPAEVGITGVAEVAAGGYHSLALTSDGSAWSWGWNYFGQLGTGTTTDSSLPVRLASLQNTTAISAGYLHSAAAG